MWRCIQRLLHGSSLFVVGILLLNSASAQEGKLKVGDPAPIWTDLMGTDGQKHSLEEFAGKAVVVVCFTCNSCPYSVDYEDRMIAFSKKYAPHPDGVVFVAINANKKPSETLEKMRERAQVKEFPFLYLADETQKVAEAWGGSYCHGACSSALAHCSPRAHLR
jgi:peroxiredoxin